MPAASVPSSDTTAIFVLGVYGGDWFPGLEHTLKFIFKPSSDVIIRGKCFQFNVENGLWTNS